MLERWPSRRSWPRLRLHLVRHDERRTILPGEQTIGGLRAFAGKSLSPGIDGQRAAQLIHGFLEAHAGALEVLLEVHERRHDLAVVTQRLRLAVEGHLLPEAVGD